MTGIPASQHQLDKSQSEYDQVLLHQSNMDLAGQVRTGAALANDTAAPLYHRIQAAIAVARAASTLQSGTEWLGAAKGKLFRWRNQYRPRANKPLPEELANHWWTIQQEIRDIKGYFRIVYGNEACLAEDHRVAEA